jgi:hypothetical protein
LEEEGSSGPENDQEGEKKKSPEKKCVEAAWRGEGGAFEEKEHGQDQKERPEKNGLHGGSPPRIV